eukprot:gene2347-1476_t
MADIPPKNSINTAAGRREELDLQLHLVQEKRRMEQKIFDEVAAEHLCLGKEELLKLVEEKMAKLFPKSIVVQGRVVRIDDYVRVKDDPGLLLAAECDLPVQDTLKRIYLGERGKLVQVVPSFHGREAAVLRFPDGAQKPFFVECLDLSGIKLKEARADAVPGAGLSGGAAERAAAPHKEATVPTSPTWDSLSAMHHQLSRNRSRYSSKASPSISDEEDDDSSPKTGLKVNSPGTAQAVQAVPRSAAPPPPPPLSLQELRNPPPPPPPPPPPIPPPAIEHINRPPVVELVSQLANRPPTPSTGSLTRSPGTISESPRKSGCLPVRRSSEATGTSKASADASTRAGSPANPAVSTSPATGPSPSGHSFIQVHIPVDLVGTPLRPIKTTVEDSSPVPHAPVPLSDGLAEDQCWANRPLGGLGMLGAAGLGSPHISASPSTPPPGDQPAGDGKPLSLQVVESSAPLSDKVLQTLVKHRGTLGGAAQQREPRCGGVAPRAVKSPRAAGPVPRCATVVARSRRKAPAAVPDTLGQPFEEDQLEPLGQPVKLLLDEKELGDGSEDEEPIQDLARLTGIPQVAPPGYKAKFSFYDANTSIPRYVPVQPTSMRRVLVAGYLSAPLGASVHGSHPIPDSARSSSQMSAPRLRFVEVFYRRDATMGVILQTVTGALGWADERAERLFTLTGNEVLWEENIEEGMQLIATPGNLYHPVRQVSEHPSTARECASTARDRLGASFDTASSGHFYQVADAAPPTPPSQPTPLAQPTDPRPPQKASPAPALRPAHQDRKAFHAAPSGAVVPRRAARRPAAAPQAHTPSTPSELTLSTDAPEAILGLPTMATVISSPSTPRTPVPSPALLHDPVRPQPAAPLKTCANPKTAAAAVPSRDREAPMPMPMSKTSSTAVGAGRAAAAPTSASAAGPPASQRRPATSKAPPVSVSKPIHIKVFENGQYDDEERVFRHITVRSNYKTIGALKTLIARELEWRDGKKVDLLFDATGVPINSLQDIRDGEALVASSGDRFIVPYPNSVLHREALKRTTTGTDFSPLTPTQNNDKQQRSSCTWLYCLLPMKTYRGIILYSPPFPPLHSAALLQERGCRCAAPCIAYRRAPIRKIKIKNYMRLHPATILGKKSQKKRKIDQHFTSWLMHLSVSFALCGAVNATRGKERHAELYPNNTLKFTGNLPLSALLTLLAPLLRFRTFSALEGMSSGLADGSIPTLPDLIRLTQPIRLESEVDVQMILKMVRDAVSTRVKECLGEHSAAADGSVPWVETYVFGSCGLGAATLKSDIDLLVLCSFFISLDHLFYGVPELLLRAGGEGAKKSKVSIVSSARVPLVKWRFEDRVDVDIVFARSSFPLPPTAEDLVTRQFLMSVSTETRVNVSGLRTCMELRRRIPVPLDSFGCVLRMVKCWASRRCVYGSMVTYPNGVILAIMLVKVCMQQCANASSTPSPTQLLAAFFQTYAEALQGYPLPPIYVTRTLEPPDQSRIAGLHPCWNFRSAAAAEELLAVINPAFPYMNSAHSVGRAGLRYFLEEVQRAAALFKQPFSTSAISQLLHPYAYPKDYEHFIAVHVLCEGPSVESIEAAFQHWKGFLQSKIRIFVYALECVVDVRPYPLPVPVPHPELRVPHHHGPPLLSVLESTMWFAVRCALEEADRLPSLVGYCFQLFYAAVMDACVAVTGRNGAAGSFTFDRDPHTMLDPWWTLHARSDAAPCPSRPPGCIAECSGRAYFFFLVFNCNNFSGVSLPFATAELEQIYVRTACPSSSSFLLFAISLPLNEAPITRSLTKKGFMSFSTENLWGEDDEDLAPPALLQVPPDPFADYDQSVVENDFNALVVLQEHLTQESTRHEEKRLEDTQRCVKLVQRYRSILTTKRTDVQGALDAAAAPPTPPHHSGEEAQSPTCGSASAARLTAATAMEQAAARLLGAAPTLSPTPPSPGSPPPWSHRVRPAVAPALLRQLECVSSAISLRYGSPATPAATERDGAAAAALAQLLRVLGRLLPACAAAATEVRTLEAAAEQRCTAHRLVATELHPCGDVPAVPGAFLAAQRRQRELLQAVAQAQALLSAALASGTPSPLAAAVAADAVEEAQLTTRLAALVKEAEALGTRVIQLRRAVGEGIPVALEAVEESEEGPSAADRALADWQRGLSRRLQLLESERAGALEKEAEATPAASPALEAEVRLLESFLAVQDGCLHAVAALNALLLQAAHSALLLLHLLLRELELDPVAIGAVMQAGGDGVDAAAAEEQAMNFLVEADDVLFQLQADCEMCAAQAQLEAAQQTKQWTNLSLRLRADLGTAASATVGPVPCSRPGFQVLDRRDGGALGLGEDVTAYGKATDDVAVLSATALEERERESQKRVQWFEQQDFAVLLQELYTLWAENARLEAACASLAGSEGVEADHEEEEVAALEVEWGNIQANLVADYAAGDRHSERVGLTETDTLRSTLPTPYHLYLQGELARHQCHFHLNIFSSNNSIANNANYFLSFLLRWMHSTGCAPGRHCTFFLCRTSLLTPFLLPLSCALHLKLIIIMDPIVGQKRYTCVRFRLRMCRTGHQDWLFTDAEACFVGPDLRLRQCLCPLTSCSATRGIYNCHLTTSVMALSTFVVLVLLLAACAYFYVSHHLSVLDTEEHLRKTKMPALAHNFFYNRLFGDETEDRTEILLSPAEVRSLGFYFDFIPSSLSTASVLPLLFRSLAAPRDSIPDLPAA